MELRLGLERGWGRRWSGGWEQEGTERGGDVGREYYDRSHVITAVRLIIVLRVLRHL